MLLLLPSQDGKSNGSNTGYTSLSLMLMFLPHSPCYLKITDVSSYSMGLISPLQIVKVRKGLKLARSAQKYHDSVLPPPTPPVFTASKVLSFPSQGTQGAQDSLARDETSHEHKNCPRSGPGL